MKPQLTLLIVALLGISLWWSNIEEKTSEMTSATATILDAYMHNFSMQAMDEAGNVAIQLTAKSMKQYSDSDMAELDTPRIIMKSDNQQWHIQSQLALIDRDKQTISLQRDVIIKRLNADQQHTLEIRTDSLQININQQIAQTDSPVEMITNEATFQSKGLLLDNRNGILSLLTEVKGVVNVN